MKEVKKKFFHQIPQEEVDKLISTNKSVGYVMANYKQPDWCSYPEALSMEFGCLSLCDLKKDGLRSKISVDFCKQCECFKDMKTKVSLDDKPLWFLKVYRKIVLFRLFIVRIKMILYLALK